MIDSNHIGVMQLRRALDADPRRAARATWKSACRLICDVLSTFGYAHVEDARDELAEIAGEAVRLIILRILKGLRLDTEIFSLELLFNSGNPESQDSVDLPLALQTLTSAKVSLTFLVLNDDERVAFNQPAHNRMVQLHVEIMKFDSEPSQIPDLIDTVGDEYEDHDAR